MRFPLPVRNILTVTDLGSVFIFEEENFMGPALPSWRTRTKIKFIEKKIILKHKSPVFTTMFPHLPKCCAMHLLGISMFSRILKITASFVLILPNSIYLLLTMQFIYKAPLPSSL